MARADEDAGGIGKRAFDLGLATVGLALSAPVTLCIALAIKLDDGGPLFFRQERWGRGGRPIWVYKFRTMRVEASQPGRSTQATADDPRITRVGRLLRATALDEFPQVLNIWKGEMSFVGPRALAINEQQAHEQSAEPDHEVPGFWERLEARPGLTGIAQIYAPRDVPRRHKFRLDVLYVRERTFWLDVRLVALSIWITLTGRWEKRGARFKVSPRPFPENVPAAEE